MVFRNLADEKVLNQSQHAIGNLFVRWHTALPTSRQETAKYLGPTSKMLLLLKTIPTRTLPAVNLSSETQMNLPKAIRRRYPDFKRTGMHCALQVLQVRQP